MLDKVIRTIKENNMIKAGDRVICALSGGADSMALLYALYEAREKLKITIYAAHLNHSIRGDAADLDQAFAEDFCKKLGVELFLRKADIPRIAKEKAIGEEECGRIERYRFFDEIAHSLGGAKIATGHHMNDRAETVMLNLFRGSGGTRGIPYVRGNVIRPLMNVTKEEIEEYLNKNNISWREDYTNKDCKYARNYIRNVVLKDIQEHFPFAVEKIVQSDDISRIDSEYLNLLANESGAFKDGVIIKEKFLPLHESLRRRVIITALKEWGMKEIDQSSVKAVYETIVGNTGKGRDLKGGIRVFNNYSCIGCKQIEKANKTQCEQIIKTGENLEISVFDGVWRVKTVDKKEKMRDNYTMILLDADKMGEEVLIRCRKDGDFMYPKGLGGRQKIKKIFIDLKIPRDKRDCISLLACGDEILFIPNIKATGRFLPDEKTKRFFIAEFEKYNT